MDLKFKMWRTKFLSIEYFKEKWAIRIPRTYYCVTHIVFIFQEIFQDSEYNKKTTYLWHVWCREENIEWKYSWIGKVKLKKTEKYLEENIFYSIKRLNHYTWNAISLKCLPRNLCIKEKQSLDDVWFVQMSNGRVWLFQPRIG